MAKATKTQATQRLNAAVKLRLGGVAIREIFQYGQDQGWGVGYDAVYKYVGKADAIITERAERDRDRLLAFEVNARNRVFARAMEKGDLEAALKVLKDRAQLLNLYPSKDQTPSAVQVNHVLPPAATPAAKRRGRWLSPDSARQILKRLPCGEVLPTDQPCLNPERILSDAGMTPNDWQTKLRRGQSI